jgi:hypothetical protein
VSWKFYPALDAFDRHRGLWGEVGASRGDLILLDPAFVGLAVRHFASPRTLLALSEGPGGPTLALVEPRRPGFWETFQPSQAPLGLVLFPPGPDGHAALRELVRRLPGWALALAVLRQDPDVATLQPAGPDMEPVDYITTSRLALTGTFADYWKSRSHNLVHNLARQRRRLAEQGVRLCLVTSRRPEEMAEGVRVYAAMESAGWKGHHGSAVAVDNRQGRFYLDLLEHFARRDEAVIYRLEMNGTPVAAALALERHATLYLLKITYDERVPRCSPGLLLHEEMLRALFVEQRIKVIEYYGRYSDWHRKWTAETRVMTHLNVYRHPLVGLARRLLRGVASRRRRAVEPEP